MGKCVPTTTVSVGDPCRSDLDCSPLGAGAICKQFTSTGTGFYVNGYCTLMCSGPSSCPMGSICESLPGHGENDSICLNRCSATGNGCRTPGYSCFNFGNPMPSACWIFPVPLVPDAGIIPPPVDAGVGEAVGAPCTDNSQCLPQSVFCVPETLSMIKTGYVGGYCSDNCSSTQACPPGSVCITENLGGVLTNSSCKSVCFNPGGGQGVCRSGYICIADASGGMVGWCGPRCTNQSVACPSGGMCNTMTGYCN
jgi:hypothetical protein